MVAIEPAIPEVSANAVASLQAESFDPEFTTAPEPEDPQTTPGVLDALSQEVFQGLQTPAEQVALASTPEQITAPAAPEQAADSLATPVQETPIALPESETSAAPRLEGSELPPPIPRLEGSELPPPQPTTLEDVNPLPTTIADLDSDAQEMVVNLQQGLSNLGLLE